MVEQGIEQLKNLEALAGFDAEGAGPGMWNALLDAQNALLEIKWWQDTMAQFDDLYTPGGTPPCTSTDYRAWVKRKRNQTFQAAKDAMKAQEGLRNLDVALVRAMNGIRAAAAAIGNLQVQQAVSQIQIVLAENTGRLNKITGVFQRAHTSRFADEESDRMAWDCIVERISLDHPRFGP